MCHQIKSQCGRSSNGISRQFEIRGRTLKRFYADGAGYTQCRNRPQVNIETSADGELWHIYGDTCLIRDKIVLAMELARGALRD